MASFVDNFTGKVWDWTKPFQRTGQFPLDRSDIFSSYADAVKYAKGDAADPDSRALYATSYVGQIISVYEDGKVNVYKIEEDRTLSGIGGGALESANYTEALSKATAENIGQIIYVTGEEEVEGVKYSAGPYIVTGAGTVAKLGTTTASGDLSADVANLKADVTTLKGDSKVEGSVDYKIANITFPVTDVKVDEESIVNNGVVDLTAILAGKVDVVEGSRLMTTAEGEKLSGIAEGAQVNKIEKIKVNGAEVTPDAQDKSVNIVIPDNSVVKGLADGENVLSIGDATGKLGTTLSLEYFKDSADNNTPKIRLKGINGAQVGDAIDASDFVKDGMLTNVELVENPTGKTGTYLQFTWNTDADKDPITTEVNVTDLIDVYVAGDGISIDGKVISAKVKANDPYIQVTTTGIESKGIDAAILNAKNAVIGESTDTKDALTIYGVRAYADKAAEAAVDAYDASLANILSNKADVTTLANTIAKIKEYTIKDLSANQNDFVKIVRGADNPNTTTYPDGVNDPYYKIRASVDVHALAGTLVGSAENEEEIGPINGTTVLLGKAITDGAAENPTNIIAATTSVQDAIQTLAGQIQAAVAGGITGISSANDCITIGGSATSKTITFETSKVGKYLVEENSSLKVNENGKLTLEWEVVE